MAQELGLHREPSCLDTGPGSREEQDHVGEASKFRTKQKEIGLEDFERSTKIMLFWCVFIHETSLVSRISDDVTDQT